MNENVYANVLRQLLALEGTPQSVASALKVPEGTLQRWMNGRAQMPLRAFLLALQRVVDHEEQRGPLGVAFAPAERLVLKAGPVVAECNKCHGQEFRRADPALPHTYRSVLACCACGEEVVHHELIAALAKEVAKRAGSYGSRSRR